MFNKYKRYDYQSCNNCELIFLNPLPGAKEISDFYPDTYEVYEESSRIKKISSLRKSILKKYYGYSHISTSFFKDLLCFLIYPFSKNFEVHYIKNGKLLDVGCGNGRYLDGMKKLGWNVQGVEFNSSAVEVCKLSGLDVHHGDLSSAEFKDNSFDVINVSHVIEHVPNPKDFFSELSRILKKNGVLLIKTPNSQALGRAWLGTNWYANDTPRHLYLFSEKNLRILADSFGLTTKNITTRTTPKIILNSIDYVVQNNKKPSKRTWWKRWLAKIYVALAQSKKQGDEIFAIFTK